MSGFDLHDYLLEQARTAEGLRRLMTEGRAHCDAFRKGRLAARGIAGGRERYVRGSLCHAAWRAGRDFERTERRARRRAEARARRSSVIRVRVEVEIPREVARHHWPSRASDAQLGRAFRRYLNDNLGPLVRDLERDAQGAS